MHLTKSLPPSCPQRPLCRQPGLPAPQGSRVAGQEGGRAQEVQGAAPTLKPRIPHGGMPPRHPRTHTQSCLRCSESLAGGVAGRPPTGLIPSMCSHWQPGFGRKYLLALKSSSVSGGCWLYPQSLLIPKGTAAVPLLLCPVLVL